MGKLLAELKNPLYLLLMWLMLAGLSACEISRPAQEITPTTGAESTTQSPLATSIDPSGTLSPDALITTSPQIQSIDAQISVAQDCETRWINSQDPGMLECAREAYQEAVDLSDPDTKPYYQFLLDRLLWQSGKQDIEARERFLTFIRQNLQNDFAKDAIEFYWTDIMPTPAYFDAGESLVIYESEITLPYMIVSGPGSSMKIRDTNVPGNLYMGKNAPALEIDWVKEAKTWDSLIIGFDERLADKSVAQAGELISLANPEDYRLEFVIKAGPGLHLWDDDFLRIKLQDQNILISESIGNQLVCHIRVSDDWVAYSLPLTEFVQDRWIYKNFEAASPAIWGGHPSLVFDWARVKQINFDMPYNAHGQGLLMMDDIILVRSATSSDLVTGRDKVKTTCLGSPMTLDK